MIAIFISQITGLAKELVAVEDSRYDQQDLRYKNILDKRKWKRFLP